MKNRDTLLGLLALALVVVGVFLARQLPSSHPAAAGRVPPSSSASTRETADRARGDAPADAALPDVTLADGTIDLGDVRVTLSVAPRPPLAFAPERFRVRVESNGEPVPLGSGRISFEMTMPMGDHRYALVEGGDGWQEAEVLLPACASGDRRWYATVGGTVAGRPRIARFRLDLTSSWSVPAPPPTP